MPKRTRTLSLLVTLVALVLVLGNRAPGQILPIETVPKISAAVETPQGNNLNYDRAPISAMIDLLAKLSGKRYILDANLFGVPPVSVDCTGLSKDDSINLITATLLLNGVAILPVDDLTMKVVTTGTNKNPRSEGMRVYTNAADLPKDDEVVTYYMALDKIDPQEAAGIFTQVAPVHVYGAYVPAPSSHGIILIENTSVIRELIALKAGIDQRSPIPPAPPRPPPPGPPGAPGFRPPHPHHPVFVLLVFLLIVAASFYAGVRRGRKKSASN
jgi:hypothetical protein